ncbi:hypothetical protein Bealeia1_01264 [Candidatus Bealeia paramacronuclearis]|uniref:Uncharacterized protein n=1 Tax=Candidatus Bealeia paramacronuclearis TaxID=1921001 RepID=A0ABZ2C6N8_9PROT|nr:hypothetical protein [Candidatus Bealeia paramacronuclearis]
MQNKFLRTSLLTLGLGLSLVILDDPSTASKVAVTCSQCDRYFAECQKPPDECRERKERCMPRCLKSYAP